MELSNRILASFLLVFIISILFGTQFILKEIDILTGLGATEIGNVSVTIAGICGDAFVLDNEVCDSTNLSGETCVTLGNTGGTLACRSDCTGFNTQQCLNATANATVAATKTRPRTGGRVYTMVYKVSAADTFDFILSRAQKMLILHENYLHEKELCTINVDDIGQSATLLITHPELERQLIKVKFETGQTIPIDLDGDGILDVYFKLTDVLTRRAVFHIEKFKPISSGKKPLPGIQVPKLESPKDLDYTDYYKESFLLLAVIILAIINFAIFKKFIISKK